MFYATSTLNCAKVGQVNATRACMQHKQSMSVGIREKIIFEHLSGVRCAVALMAALRDARTAELALLQCETSLKLSSVCRCVYIYTVCSRVLIRVIVCVCVYGLCAGVRKVFCAPEAAAAAAGQHDNHER